MKTFEEFTEGSLHKWFKGSKSKDGKGGWVNVVTGGTCASDEPGEGTPKCVSSAKRASMTKAERLSAARRKKKADPGQQSKSGAAKPTYVATDKPKKKMKEGVEVDEGATYTYQGKRYKKLPDKVGKNLKGNTTGGDDRHELGKVKDAITDRLGLTNTKKTGVLAKDAVLKTEGKVSEAKELKTVAKELEKASKLHKGQSKALAKASKMHKGQSEKIKKHLGDMQKEEALDEKCWKGYEKKGMKTMFGKRYPNCVKKKATRKEEVQVEAKVDQGRSDYGKASIRNYRRMGPGHGEPAMFDPENKRGKTIDKRREEHKARRGVKGAKVPAYKTEEIEMQEATPAWQRKEGKNPEGGLNQKGVDSYRRANPGSKLKTAVTTKPSKLKKGSKSAKRRKSFCARMKGMKAKLTSAKTARDPDSRINKSLRKWNCSYEPEGTPIMEKEDKAFNFVLDKIRKEVGKDGYVSKDNPRKPQTAAQKVKVRAHQAKIDKENAAARAKDPSQGRYPKG